ncbi:hypothetical protein Tco_0795048 [Tanacetum coccineum]
MSQEKEAQIKLYKTREDKELDKVIALENKVKVLNDIVYKTGQYVQTMNMLNRNCKTSFAKPEFLDKYGSVKNHKKTIKKNEQARTRESEEFKTEARKVKPQPNHGQQKSTSPNPSHFPFITSTRANLAIFENAELAQLLHQEELAQVEKRQRERATQEEASIAALYEEYDTIQANIDADALSAARLQQEERERAVHH